MSHHAALLADLRSARKFFEISTACLTEEDSGFAPVPGTWTVAQQVAHAAQTVDWFREGAFRPEGFEMDFKKLAAEVQEFRSLAAARPGWRAPSIRSSRSSRRRARRALPSRCRRGSWAARRARP